MADSHASGHGTPGIRPGAGVLSPFRAIYEEHAEFVRKCTRRLGVPAEAVDDVVQEVFVVVHARLHTVERPESLRGWIYGVVRRTVSTHHRARNVRAARECVGVAVEHVSGPTQPSPLDLAVLSDEVHLLWGLLSELDDAKWEVLVLTEFEEMTVPEAAESIGIPLNTAYSRLRAARQEFAEAYGRQMARRNAKD